VIESSDRNENAILAALPARERNAAHRASELHALVLGDIILRANTYSSHAFFPTAGVLSLVRTMQGAGTVEVAIVGSEGVVGVEIFTGGARSLDDVVVQAPGEAWCMPAGYLLSRFQNHAALQSELLRFTGALFAQISQTSACNRLHDTEARLARWLLMMHDRLSSPEIRVTQQFLAQMLGARTATINEGVQKLEAAGAIVHRRQEISICDRGALERSACECYAAVQHAYAWATDR
jgi:CRP-like cAMP-binding protein